MKDGKTCNMRACAKKYLFSALTVFAFLFLAEFVVHHIWLKGLYETTTHLWRPKSQMAQFFPLVFVYQGALALIITALYFKCKKSSDAADLESAGKKKCPRQHALCFGLVIGLLLGTMHAGAYIWMPISCELAIKWFISGLLEGVGAGLVLSCNFCAKKDATSEKIAK